MASMLAWAVGWQKRKCLCFFFRKDTQCASGKYWAYTRDGSAELDGLLEESKMPMPQKVLICAYFSGQAESRYNTTQPAISLTLATKHLTADV